MSSLEENMALGISETWAKILAVVITSLALDSLPREGGQHWEVSFEHSFGDFILVTQCKPNSD